MSDVPCNLDLERAVLGTVLKNPELLAELRDRITPDDFLLSAHAQVYSEYLAGRVTPFTVRVEEFDRAGITALMDDLPPSFSLSDACDTLVDLSDRRMIQATLEGALRGIDHPDSAEDVATAVIENIKRSVRASRDSGVTIADAISTMLKEMDDTVDVMPTSLPTLDRIGAGYRPGELTVLAGRPSSGKSAFALQSAKEVAKAGYEVWFASLEMTASSLSMRWLSNASQVDFGHLRTRTMSDVEYHRLSESVETLSALPIRIDDKSGLGLGDLRRAMLGQKGLLVVDYLQLLLPPAHARGYGSRVAEVGAISRGLKAIAHDCQVAVLALSQLNRGVESRGGLPYLSDLRDSGEIEQDADIVSMIHRIDDPEVENRSVLAVRKFRNGPLAEIELVFDGAVQRFRERQPDDPQPGAVSAMAKKVREW
jgi:replicative DNA helicase